MVASPRVIEGSFPFRTCHLASRHLGSSFGTVSLRLSFWSPYRKKTRVLDRAFLSSSNVSGVGKGGRH